ncbi:MAG TPA: hypothetical protein VHJ82_03660 [Actinomycetota bacterium]|nr:hypothetical protein [Actinomycetota bacterium]
MKLARSAGNVLLIVGLLAIGQFVIPAVGLEEIFNPINPLLRFLVGLLN